MAAIDRLHVLGVRHHSPACARRVRAQIEALRPAFVLIEGPADFNPYINDLRAAHELPLAIFSFQSGAGQTQASYSPFCVYSPEWQALQTAWAIGATPLFCDLPAWHPDFGARENRYADPHDLDGRYAAAQQRLMRELGAEGADALWDCVAEQTPDGHLERVLDAYFEGIRPAGSEDLREAAREICMGQYAAWALDQAGDRDVVVVCGGWHASAIRHHAALADGHLPKVPEPDEGVQVGSYLVPYSYARLDRFSGYASGMPSPAYYEQLFERGHAAAVAWGMRAIAAAFRGAGQPLSTADMIAWQAQSDLLARLRGHRAILRCDLLDGALSTLVKEALEGPPGWNTSGHLPHGDPAVLLMLRTLSGSRSGRLVPGTRHPPLIADVDARLCAAGIDLQAGGRRIELDWHREDDRPTAQLLHQLCLLGLPGVQCVEGPRHTDSRQLCEVFEIRLHPDWLGALIEASIWGGTLEAAAAACLGARVATGVGIDELAAVISEAAFAGLLGVGGQLIAVLAGQVSLAQELEEMGNTGLRLAQLYRFGEVFGASLHAGLQPLCQALFGRILWLLENTGSGVSGDAVIMAVAACRDFLRYGDGLSLDAGFAESTLGRCVHDPQAPPVLAGAALGFLVVRECSADGMAGIAAQIRRHGLPGSLGDFLAGLLALAREQLGAADEMFGLIDDWVRQWTGDEFLIALPAMRGAFSWLPPRERERIACLLLRRAGLGEVEAHGHALAWMRQKVNWADQGMAMQREARTRERLARHGLKMEDAGSFSTT